MVIEYYTRNNYGRDTMYILNDEIATVISNLTRKKTIDKYDMENLQKLGFTFKEVLQPRQ